MLTVMYMHIYCYTYLGCTKIDSICSMKQIIQLFIFLCFNINCYKVKCMLAVRKVQYKKKKIIKDWDCVLQEPAVTGTDFYTWKMLNYRSCDWAKTVKESLNASESFNCRVRLRLEFWSQHLAKEEDIDIFILKNELMSLAISLEQLLNENK